MLALKGLVTRSCSRFVACAFLLALSPALAQQGPETPPAGGSQDATPPVAGQPEAEEAEKTVTWGVDVEAVSKYIWRGLNLNDDLSIQPNVWVSAYGFNAALWGQIATDPLEDDNLEEIDLTLSYGHTFGAWSLEGGLLRYMYPGFEDVDSTNELYLTAGYEYWLNPSVGVYRDLDVESWYLELSVAPEYSVGEKLTLSPGLVAALYTFDDQEVIDDEEQSSDLNRLEPSVTLGYDIGGGLSATAHVHYVIALSDEIEGFFENRFWGAVGLSYEF